jgi:hypothetical protein
MTSMSGQDPSDGGKTAGNAQSRIFEHPEDAGLENGRVGGEVRVMTFISRFCVFKCFERVCVYYCSTDYKAFREGGG